MEAALRKGERLDLGCVASRGGFRHGKSGYEIKQGNQPAAAFLFEQIARLQTMATVPMIDVRACAKWLKV
jgi:hypothetical protein